MTPPPSHRFLRTIVRGSIHHPIATLLLWCTAVLLGAPGLLDVRFETTARGFLDHVDPAWERYQVSTERFGSDEVIVVAFESSVPFDAEALVRVAEFSRHAERVPGVRRVDSLATMASVRGLPDGSTDFSPPLDREPEWHPELGLEVKRRLEGDRIVPDLMVSADGRTLAVNVLLDEDGHVDRAQVISALRVLLGEGGSWISGVPVFETRVGLETREELTRLVPLAIALLALLLALATRAWMGVMVPLGASGLPCLLLLEIMGKIGAPFTMLSMLLPSVLLALGCAYAMHLLVASRGVTAPADLERAVLSVGRPTLLSGVTTALGFLAISVAPIDAIRELGLLGAAGVVLTLSAALTLVPALLRLVPRPEREDAWDLRIERGFAPRALALVWSRRRVIIGCWALVAVVFGWGIVRLEIETDVVHWFPRTSEIRSDYDHIRDRLSGISPINVVIEATGDTASAASPEAVAAMAALTSHLESLPEVGRAISIADPLRQLHGGFGDDPSQPLPQDGRLIQQYLLLLDSIEEIDDLITPDHRSANVMLRMNHNGSGRLLGVAHAAEEWWSEHGPSDLRATSTGIMFEFARSQEAITRGQLTGLCIALVTIGVIMLSVLRSFRTALIALVPNAIPIIVVFGFLGLADIPLDAAIVCLGSLALGIAVDDTTHIVLRYQDAVGKGAEPDRALAEAFRSVLPAVVLSTLAVSAGFAVLALSDFTLTRNLGLVTVSLVTACLIADATLLPALLIPARGRSALTPPAYRDAYLPPVSVYEAQPESEVEAIDADKEHDDALDAPDVDWMRATVEMNPGFDLHQTSRSEQIALSMLDPRTAYSLAIDSSVLQDKDRAHAFESVLWMHRLLLPLALLESWRVMGKIGLYRLRHLPWCWSERIDRRTRFLLGPRRIVSSLADASSPVLYALRHGVTTSAALDILYNCNLDERPRSSASHWLSTFWLQEPHAQGVRNRLKMLYWELLDAMRARHRAGQPVRVLSLACGSAQSVIEAVSSLLEEAPDADVRVDLVDLDAPSLRRAERLAQARGVRSRIHMRRQNIREFLAEDTRTWPIIEMVGFLDYRPDRSLIETCRRIRSRLEPGGIFFTATICPSAWASVVRWMANWPYLIRRRPAKFRSLLEKAGYRHPQDRYELDRTRTFLLAYLRK